MHRQKRWTNQVWDHCLTLGWERKQVEKESNGTFSACTLGPWKTWIWWTFPSPTVKCYLFLWEREDYDYSPTSIDTFLFKEESEANPGRWVCTEPQYCSLFLHPAPKLHKQKGIFHSLITQAARVSIWPLAIKREMYRDLISWNRLCPSQFSTTSCLS